MRFLFTSTNGLHSFRLGLTLLLLSTSPVWSQVTNFSLVWQDSNNLTLTWPTNDPCLGAAFSTNLTSTNWTLLAIPSVTNGQFALSVPRSNDTARFFRLQPRPPGPPVPIVLVNEQYAEEGNEEYGVGYTQYVKFNSATPPCDLGTGCPLTWPLDGTLTNHLDASQTVDGAPCASDTPLEYQWMFRYPPAIMSGGYYTHPGLIGTNTAHLTILPSSMPALSGADVHWRVILRITKHTPNGDLIDEALFRFQYDSSELQLHY